MEAITQRKRKRHGRKKVDAQSIRVINPNAAGIDIGSQTHYVAVPSDRDPNPVQTFECFTADLHRMAEWLQGCGVTTVAMESTGVYWIPVFEILESHGLEVSLVNARHAKNLPGRKTDVHDARWLQELHSYGLLGASFHPENDIRTLRTYVRHRDNLLKASTPHIQRMHKALTQMNIQVHEVLSDITGVTGLRIIDAILSGERDPAALAALKHVRIRASDEVLIKSLQGDFRDELLFVLRQELQAYRFIRAQIEECEEAIRKVLASLSPVVDLQQQPLPPSTKANNRLPELREHLYRITGVDLTAIPGLDAVTIQSVLAETGLDMTRWPTEKHFVSWATLAPPLRISGGRRLPNRPGAAASRVGQAFRMAAESLSRSKSALGSYYRRLRARISAPAAIGAAARKLACHYYNCLRERRSYVEIGAAAYDERSKARMLRSLRRRALELGYTLAPVDTVSVT